MLKYNHYFLILLFCLIYESEAIAQSTEWFVLNNSGSMINAMGAGNDEKGNLYVTGDFTDEVLFKSSQDSGVTNYNYYSRGNQPFLLKYDNVGNLKRVLRAKTYSNSIYAVTVKVLASGEVAWVIRVSGKYSIIDEKGKEFPFQASEQSVLVLLSENGEVMSQTALPFNYCRKIIQYGNDQLLLYGDANQNRNKEVHSMDLGTLQTKQLFTEVKDLYSICTSTSELFLLAVKLEQSRYQKDSAEIRLYSAQLDQLEKSPDLLFTKQHSGWGLGQSYLFTEGNQIDVIITQKLRKNSSFTFGDLTFTSDEDQLMLFKLDKRGEVVEQFSMDTRVNGMYNTSMKQDAKGGYYFLTPAMNEIKIKGQDSSITVPKHRDFIHELVLFKLDDKLDYQWSYNLGGTASNYHHSFIVPYDKGLYYATDLLDFVTIDGKYHELEWRAGLLLGRIKNQ